MIADPELVWFLASIDYRDAVLSGNVLEINAAAQARIAAWLEAEALAAEGAA